MRHQVSGKRLGRGSNQRKALMKGLAIALLREERIETTEVKAKELRKFVEPFITLSKTDSIANRRLAMARLGSKETVQKIFGADFRKRFETRPGGYTRILKMAPRHGDGAEMALIELVDYQLPAEEA
ncbi:MAG TPA: 50S ribosomal protein L17 [Holophagaceae bacterium]|jgi:large subunit ribosomal protein L17|nr:50S ribosomal protein L17 [Holophagaceae bacterium]